MNPYLELFIVVFIANVLPAFAPPTWILLSNYQLSKGLDLWITVFVGIIAAALGRVLMYFYSLYFYRFLPAHKKEKIKELKAKLEKSKKGIAAFMFLYSLGPLPSNIIFIFSGIAKLPLIPIITGFVAGRFISYSFGILAFGRITSFLEENNIHVIGYLDAITLLITLALLFIDWHNSFIGGKHENRRYRRYTLTK
jgi:membrane protein YqaA with SNARE-associated domain